MKITGLLFVLLFIASCSEGQFEELVFRKTLEYDLTDLCGKDEACVEAVKSRIKGCMVKSNWRQFLEHQDDEEEKTRFVTEFYACIVDENGNSFFEPNL